MNFSQIRAQTLPDISTKHTKDSILPAIHILVALCDNIYQGIVPVPAKIGIGNQPNSNLYWGCGYGIKSYFKKSSEWRYIKKLHLTDSIIKDSIILERLLFQHISSGQYLLADAYNGQYIKNCTRDFIFSVSGQLKDTIHHQQKIIGVNGHANLIAYIGHDGLMDFDLTDSVYNTDGRKRDCIILACRSRDYFKPFISKAGGNALVWTTGLMCPEAYTVHDAIVAYCKKQSHQIVRNKAAEAYSKYQKCSLKAAMNLLVGN
ncbi:MAG: hypothetical protein ACKOXF_00960 [Chitinophagaceae bacterium]